MSREESIAVWDSGSLVWIPFGLGGVDQTRRNEEEEEEEEEEQKLETEEE